MVDLDKCLLELKNWLLCRQNFCNLLTFSIFRLSENVLQKMEYRYVMHQKVIWNIMTSAVWYVIFKLLLKLEQSSTLLCGGRT